MPAVHPDLNIDIEEYFRRYGPMVFRRCRQMLKDDEKAGEAMQEVFLKLLKSKDRLQNRFPSSLLFRISTNTCLNMIRSLRKELPLDDTDITTVCAFYPDIEKRVVFRDLLHRIFMREKPGTREIAVMRFLDGMTLEEVAGETGLSVSGVRKRIREFQARVKTGKEVDDGS
jgi:RNA polymerase sigma-70 factor (ECF subfamily)